MGDHALRLPPRKSRPNSESVWVSMATNELDVDDDDAVGVERVRPEEVVEEVEHLSCRSKVAPTSPSRESATTLRIVTPATVVGSGNVSSPTTTIAR